MAPISWTSKWRMPRVRFIASRPAANTSGIDVVEHRLEPLLVPLAARLGEVAAALEVGVVELVLGRLLGGGVLERSPRGSRRSAPGSPSSERASNSASSSLVWSIDRLEPAQLAVVGVEESGEEAHGRLSIGWVRGCPGRRLGRRRSGPRLGRGSVLQAARWRRVDDDLRLGHAARVDDRHPARRRRPGRPRSAFGAPSIADAGPATSRRPVASRRSSPLPSTSGAAREQRRRQGRGAEHEGRPRREHPATISPAFMVRSVLLALRDVRVELEAAASFGITSGAPGMGIGLAIITSSRAHMPFMLAATVARSGTAWP